MRNILSHAHRGLLGRFARSNVLLAFDFDGTLAPIVDRPERAVMRKATRALFGRVATLYRVAVISGRARTDISSRLDGIAVESIVGNHGMETALRCEASATSVWMPVLRDRLASLQGVEIEDKGLSASVHYRHARDERAARRAILSAARDLGPVRVIGGKKVLNLLPADAPDKGVALERERERLECDNAIYVGDDETDEDVFRLQQPARLLPIRVGADPDSGATYCIPDQRAVDDLLTALVEQRSAPSRRSAS